MDCGSGPQSVCALVAQDKLLDAAYTSPAGTIAPLDILYGHRPPMARGNLYMAHRCGFTQKVLTGTLQASGFAAVAARRREHPNYDLWALATVAPMPEAELRVINWGQILIKSHDLADVPRGTPGWGTDNPTFAARDFAAKHPEFVIEQPAWPFNESSQVHNITHWPGAWLKRL